MNVCVYCSSSDRVAPVYFDAARKLGQLLGERKNNLVYGGGNTGPMKALAEGVKETGGRVLSVIPKIFDERGLTFSGSDETVVTANLQERRITMIRDSDVFMALPGGFGTLEEVAENLTMRQLGLHARPLCLVNVNRYWTPLLALLDQMVEGNFAKPEHRALLHVVGTPEEGLDYVDRYAPVDVPDKWSD
ncbi:MAG: cytokinin riboside 5'-monophosphate phosphoribohydrolase [Gemmatimonadota bacterium]|nr:MAG: cytokinin riboside 5'-monophosphate phosphoribohydrolase [Gemmatimonadota bacterium]